MKKIITVIIGLLALSCSTDNKNDLSSTNYDVGLSFKVTSVDGTDLLNPANPNSFLKENIKIYYIRNNVKVEVYNPNLDNPRNFSIVPPSQSGLNYYYFDMALNNQTLQNAITIIEWNNTDSDTIRANFDAGNNYMLLSKAWYNEVLVLDNNTNTLPVIIKN
jgi:hypothetical protein